MAQVTLLRSSCEFFKVRIGPAVESKRRIAVAHFGWDPQADCGFLREDRWAAPRLCFGYRSLR